MKKNQIKQPLYYILIRCCINCDYIIDYVMCVHESQASFAKSTISTKQATYKDWHKKI